MKHVELDLPVCKTVYVCNVAILAAAIQATTNDFGNGCDMGSNQGQQALTILSDPS